MGLLGQGAVAIWHDIAAEGREDFYAWHGTEHMPERVGIPGFLRGRRYQAIEADLEFFNLYEAVTPEVLTGPDYQARLDDPTPWTRAAVRHFRDVARSICRVDASHGPGQGGLAATWRYDVAEGRQQAHREALGGRLLPRVAEAGGIAGCHLLIADRPASAVDTAERKLREGENRVPGWIIVVEGWGDEAPFRQVCRSMLSAEALEAEGAEPPIAFGLYRLQTTANAPAAAGPE